MALIIISLWCSYENYFLVGGDFDQAFIFGRESELISLHVLGIGMTMKLFAELIIFPE
jgi:hypothetical protein